MCGICGKLTWNSREIGEKVLRGMLDALAHRGPDDEGVYLYNSDQTCVGLGHRRLSIIDLSAAGRQPLTNEDGSLQIVFNGEIYNFSVLREELRQKGHRFRSRTDTEVILHLYEEEGIACVKRLIGMFAFSIWDERRLTLHLVRDPAGIKPLVYYRDGQTLVFASEIKALLADPDIPRNIDRQSLELYLTLNYIPAPYTIFQNIQKLNPGCCLTIQGGQLRETVYWKLSAGREIQGTAGEGKALGVETPQMQPWAGNEAEARHHLFNTLSESVRSQMIADVPLGAFLSGGIDSSIIVALMARSSTRPVQTFTIGYTDMPMYDERAYARAVADMYATDHHEILLTSQDMISVVPEVLDSLDEPFGDSSAVPTYVVSRETRKHVKVALSGDGGDELFAGYRMYRGEELYQTYARIPAIIRKTLIEPLIAALPESRDAAIPEFVRRMKKFLKGAKGNNLAERFLLWNELFPEGQRGRLLLDNPSLNRTAGLLNHGDRENTQADGSMKYSNSLEDRRFGSVKYATALDIFSSALASFRDDEFNGDALNRMLYADFTVSLPGDMLRKVDAMSMAHALEVRVPLLDHRVCELAFSMPGAWKLRKGQGKAILIDTFRDLLPPALHHRPKWGFEVPVSKWLKAEWRFLIDEYLSKEIIVKQGIFHYERVNELIVKLFSERFDTSWQLWNLICFQAWYYRYMERKEL